MSDANRHANKLIASGGYPSLESRFSSQCAVKRVARLADRLSGRVDPLAKLVLAAAKVRWGFDAPQHLLISPEVVLMHNALGVVAHPDCRIEGPSILFHSTTLGNNWADHDGTPNIKPFTFIGAGAQILGPIEIGPFAGVAAGAVVTESVPPWTLAVGQPARNRPLDRATVRRWFDLTTEQVP